jgi:CxxC-x17-CxxC domain-containing protein
MADFRSNNRSGFSRGRDNGRGRGRDSSGGSRFFGNGGRRSRSFEKRNGGFGGRNRDFGERRPIEMHEVTCDKCKQQCKVPFRPTGDKPVYCSACFEQTGNSGSRRNAEQAMSAMSKEQFAEINAKLDKILQALNELEIVTDEDGAEIDSDGEDEDAEEIIEDDSESEDEE